MSLGLCVVACTIHVSDCRLLVHLELLQTWCELLQRITILILDELDQACKTTEEAVQKIFSLSTLSSSRLVVIGIANRLDLAHRVLQPLGAASGSATPAPSIISFHSYTARQLLQLLQVWPDVTPENELLLYCCHA